MPLPNDFNEIENLQDLVKIEHNKAVDAWFKNQANDDVSSPKARLKHSCKIKDSDSVLNAILRMWLFEITVGHTQSIQTPIYGVPVQELQREGKFRPQIKLYFNEPYDYAKHGDGTPRIKGEIGFRIMDKTASTITRANAEEYAREIKAEFTNPMLVWKKGKYKCTYLDLENGYDLRLLCISKAEGESLVKSVLKILDHTYNDNNFQFIENTKEYPANPGTHVVYGKTVRKSRQRPTADLKLTHAQLVIPGQIKAVTLLSVNGRSRSAILTAGAI